MKKLVFLSLMGIMLINSAWSNTYRYSPYVINCKLHHNGNGAVIFIEHDNGENLDMSGVLPMRKAYRIHSRCERVVRRAIKRSKCVRIIGDGIVSVSVWGLYRSNKCL